MKNQEEENKTQLLKDWLPSQLDTFGLKVEKFLDYEVLVDIGWMDSQTKPSDKYPFPFTHKNVMNWCIVSNGIKTYAVGWNESPSIGWSFPVKKYELK